MSDLVRRVILYSFLLLPGICLSQPYAEYLVEINTTNGSFEAPGPPLEDIFVVYGGVQCKDEVNGEYTFAVPNNGGMFVTADISSGQIVHTAPYSILSMWAGVYCLNNCDTLVMANLDQQTQMHYVMLYDRINGVQLGAVGDSVPDQQTTEWNYDNYMSAYDQTNDHLYLYNTDTYDMRVMEIPSGNIINTYDMSVVPEKMVFDDVNGKLYGIRFMTPQSRRVLLFNEEAGDFESVGEPFIILGGNYRDLTVDGNNNRLIYSTTGSQIGSTVVIADALTGELLDDFQTISTPNSSLSGANTKSGLYFNSTDQLISLHWGPGTNLSTRDLSNAKDGVRAYPNPSKGFINFQFPEEQPAYFDLNVYDTSGTLVHQQSRIRNSQRVELLLPNGFYSTLLFTEKGELYRSAVVIQE